MDPAYGVRRAHHSLVFHRRALARFAVAGAGKLQGMTPEELVCRKAARLSEPQERARAEFAARQLGTVMFQQRGVVSLAQLRGAGLAKHDIERLLRYRALRRVHRKVYVDHTGELTLEQRVRAAVLAAGPAVVCGPTLADASGEGPVHIAVEASRHVAPLDGVVIHRVRNLDAVAQWKTDPPRMRREDNVIAMIDAAVDELAVVRLLTDASRDRAIGVERLREALGRRTNLRRRAFVAAVLDDVAAGAQSVLEWGYLTRIERPHGLPAAERQVTRRTAGGKQYRDVVYAGFTVVVELDGRLNHDSWEAENRDADRDLDEAASGQLTIRLRWRQVFGTPCQTAVRLERVLRARGWAGKLRRCPRCP